MIFCLLLLISTVFSREIIYPSHITFLRGSEPDTAYDFFVEQNHHLSIAGRDFEGAVRWGLITFDLNSISTSFNDIFSFTLYLQHRSSIYVLSHPADSYSSLTAGIADSSLTFNSYSTASEQQLAGLRYGNAYGEGVNSHVASSPTSSADLDLIEQYLSTNNNQLTLILKPSESNVFRDWDDGNPDNTKMPYLAIATAAEIVYPSHITYLRAVFPDTTYAADVLSVAGGDFEGDVRWGLITFDLNSITIGNIASFALYLQLHSASATYALTHPADSYSSLTNCIADPSLTWNTYSTASEQQLTGLRYGNAYGEGEYSHVGSSLTSSADLNLIKQYLTTNNNQLTLILKPSESNVFRDYDDGIPDNTKMPYLLMIIADCDDGLFCNGDEYWDGVENVCKPGVNITCGSHSYCDNGAAQCVRDCVTFAIDEYLIDCSAEFGDNEIQLESMETNLITLTERVDLHDLFEIDIALLNESVNILIERIENHDMNISDINNAISSLTTSISSYSTRFTTIDSNVATIQNDIAFLKTYVNDFGSAAKTTIESNMLTDIDSSFVYTAKDYMIIALLVINIMFIVIGFCLYFKTKNTSKGFVSVSQLDDE